MNNPEYLALAFILHTRALQDFLKAGLRPEHFGSPQTQEAIGYLIQFHKDHGSLPTQAQFSRRFPWFQPEPLPEGLTVSGVTTELVEFSLQREVSTKLVGLQLRKFIRGEHVKDLIRDLRDLVAKHETFDLADAADYKNLPQEWYEEGKSKKITGIPYPFAILNAETRGMQKHDFLLIFGRPKSGKTWVLLKILAHVHDWMPEGSRVLFVSYEMDLQRLMNRLACIKAKLDYGRFNKAALTDEEKARLASAMKALEEDKAKRDKHIYFAGPAIRTSGRRGFSLLDIEQSAETVEPVAIFIDGLLHAKDARTGKRSREWSVVSNISSDTKQLALARHCPIICTHQANRESEISTPVETQRDIAYADALAQDADLSLRVTKIRTDSGRRLVLQPEGAREFELLGFTVGGSFCENMEEGPAITEPKELKRLLAKVEDDDPLEPTRRSKKSGSDHGKMATTASVVRASLSAADVIPIAGGTNGRA